MSFVPNPIIVPLNIASDRMAVPLSVSSNTEQLALDVACVIVSGMSEHYAGAYEFEPTDSAQIIPIKDMVADANIVINPIPSQYGKISWDGSVLTVS